VLFLLRCLMLAVMGRFDLCHREHKTPVAGGVYHFKRSGAFLIPGFMGIA